MTFAAPWFLVGGLVAITGIVALHFLARQQPVRWLLPTARFVPESKERAPARSVALSDRILLALRVAALALAALAFARPSLTVARRARVQVIVADASRAVRDAGEVVRVVSAAQRAGDRVLWFGSRPNESSDAVASSGGAPVTGLGSAPARVAAADPGIVAARGSLSAALVRAVRAAHALRDEADSVAIVVVSPFVREEFDAATAAIRATWPAGIERRVIAAAGEPPRTATVLMRATATDPLQATLDLGGFTRAADAPVRLVRDAQVAEADSLWSLQQGHVLVHWPAALNAGRDAIGAVVTAGTVLVAGFARPVSPRAGAPIAWWADGEIAAAEQRAGAGCRRNVWIPVTPVGDVALRERMRDLVRDLTASCGGAHDLRAADSATLAMIAGSAPVALATSALPARRESGRAAVPWLLALALLALVVEQVMRRREVAT